MRSRCRVTLSLVSGLCIAPQFGGGATLESRERDPIAHLQQVSWEIDSRPVLTRGGETAVDRGVVGDPCIVWDETIATWRMFYFASGVHPETGARGRRTAMALAAGAEQIGPGD